MKKMKMKLDKVNLRKTIGNALETAGELCMLQGFNGLIPKKWFGKGHHHYHHKPNINNVKR